jgi:aerobic carbon-monoxide dehydrogenase small subunit
MSDRGLRISVNGTAHDLPGVPDDERLLDTLRWRVGLKGTKEGCRTGDCGACTVLVEGLTTLSCLTLAHEVEGTRVTTVDAPVNEPELARVQAAFERAGALQCGYCIPGFVVAVAGLLKERGSRVSREELLEGLGGNLCRCTGYASIVRAVGSLAEEPR